MNTTKDFKTLKSAVQDLCTRYARGDYKTLAEYPEFWALEELVADMCTEACSEGFASGVEGVTHI